MKPRTYQDDDAGYLAWLHAHRKDGWVANTTRTFGKGILKIHRASCGNAANEAHKVHSQPLTGGAYVKTVSTSLADLWTWALTKQFDGLPHDALGRCCCRGMDPPTGEPGRPTYRDFGPAPADDPAELERFARRVRRGQPKFRARLLKAYGGACAVTGTGIDAVLEAAHIEPHAKAGRNGDDNGLLLRSDIHVLFDLGLLRIHPKTLRVSLRGAARQGPYAALEGVELRVRTDGARPSATFLKAHWNRGE